MCPPDSGSAPNVVFTRQVGVYTGDDAWAQLDAAGRPILAVDQDSEGVDIKTALNARLRKDYGNFGADADINGFKFVNVGNASARTNYAAAGQVQDSSLVYVTAAGTGDAITLDLTPSITAYTAGQKFHFKASATNTGATTINIDGLGAKDVRKGAAGSTVLAAGDITSGGIYEVAYDGSVMQIINPGLGRAATSIIDITGTTAVTDPAVGDELLAYDLSATANRKITLANLFKVITAFTAETAPAVDDELALYDLSAAAADKITLANFFKVINGFTEDTTPDRAADFVPIYDTSAGTVKKAKPDSLGAYVLIQTQTASNSSVIDFALPAGYHSFRAMYSTVVPSVDGVYLLLRVSTNSGSSYAAGASDYGWGLSLAGTPTTAEYADGSTTDVALGVNLGTGTGEFCSGELVIHNPFDTTKYKGFTISAAMWDAAPETINLSGGGHYRGATSALTNIRFLMDSGNIASGTFILYGMKSS